jgi:hypothetical protein
VSARDELRGTLSNTICNASNYTKRAQPYLLGSDMSAVLDKTADNILAAGYSKPRTVTTAEELDALAEGAVILSDEGGVFEHEHGWWRVTGSRDPMASSEISLSAAVLYEGDET